MSLSLRKRRRTRAIRIGASFLKNMGDLAGAVPLFREELDAMRDQHGPEHDGTLDSARNLHGVMLELGDVSGAAGLVAEFGGL